MGWAECQSRSCGSELVPEDGHRARMARRGAPLVLLASSLDPPRGKPGNRCVRAPLLYLRGLAFSAAVVSSAVPRESSLPGCFTVWFPPVEPGGFRSAWLWNIPVTAPIRLAAQRAPYPRSPPSPGYKGFEASGTRESRVVERLGRRKLEIENRKSGERNGVEIPGAGR